MRSLASELNSFLVTMILRLALIAALMPALTSVAAPAGKPNFLLILTDDEGYGNVSTYHQSDARTPSIDRMPARPSITLGLTALVRAFNDHGIWSWSEGNLSLIAREDGPAFGRPGSTLPDVRVLISTRPAIHRTGPSTATTID
jgi:hypothetical protein